MPGLLSVISTVGVAAMLWVGGHILLVGTDELGWHGPYELVHHLEEEVHHAVEGIGAVLGWLAGTAASAIVGVVVGAVAVGAVHLVPRRKGSAPDQQAHRTES
jgi:predicted DNA repair protein MutK